MHRLGATPLRFSGRGWSSVKKPKYTTFRLSLDVEQCRSLLEAEDALRDQIEGAWPKAAQPLLDLMGVAHRMVIAAARADEAEARHARDDAAVAARVAARAGNSRRIEIVSRRGQS